MRAKTKSLMAGLLTLAMLLSLLPTVSITAAAETTASCGQAMIVDSGSETLTDVSLEKDVYILQGSELTTSGSVTITGDVYVFGTLRNTGTLVVSGTINCLHYGSMFSAGNYDYGYFYSTGSTKVTRLNVTDSWLSVTIPAASHTQGEAVIENEVAASCTTDGSYDTVVYCTACGDEISRETVTVNATGHTAGTAMTENSVAATCTKNGSYDTVVYCTVCGEEISRETVTVNATGHTAGTAVTENAVAATCTKNGSYDTVVYCTACGVEMSRETVTVDATGHSYTSEVTKAATCTEDSVITYTCSACGDTYTETIAATGHTAGTAVAENSVAATCAKDGSYETVVYCIVCGEEISRETVTVDATGHSYTSEVSTEATCTEDGMMTYTCSTCGDTYTETIAATGHSWDEGVETTPATRYTEGVITYTCTVCGDSYTEIIPALTGADAEFLFSDVYTETSDNNWYYKAVYWAYDLGVTTGTSDTLFSPGDSCTRAQFVTFLWRLAGEPAPTTTSCSFTDLDTGEYYYNAVLWAVEQGVTNGTSATAFSPNDKISRAQAVTMLYRNAGTPSVSGLSNSFADVPASEYYYNAVLWAVEQGITNGTSDTTFSPGDTCDRAMMVTYLYRYAVEPLTTG